MLSTVVLSSVGEWLQWRKAPSVRATQAVLLEIPATGTIAFEGIEGTIDVHTPAVQRAIQHVNAAGKIADVAIVAKNEAIYITVQNAVRLVQHAGAQRTTFTSPKPQATAR
jgi:biopolymer transport protein ExbD